MKLDRYQKNLLERILDAYEETATYRGEGRVNRNVRVEVEKIFPDYYRDDAKISELRAFEESMRRMEKNTPVRIIYRDRKTKNEFRAFTIPASMVEPDLYSLAGRVPKRELHLGQLRVYEAFRGKGRIADRFIRNQEELLKADKNAWFDPETAVEVLRAVCFAEKNDSDILFRELSIALFGDTKYMEKRKLFSKMARVLRNFGTFEFAEEDFESGKEYNAAVFAEFLIYENPTYVNFNGNGSIVFSNGTHLKLRRGVPVALRSDKIREITEFRVEDAEFLTIENLTSYNRLETEMFQVFLAGYHNRAKQDFLKKIHQENPGIKRWLHFGDLDPDGFCILENLREKTGIDFQPYKMEEKMLDEYAKYTKELTASDRKKAENLLEAAKYPEVMQRMLRTGKKLEQEIISWKDT